MTVVLIVAAGVVVYLILVLVCAACIDTDPPARTWRPVTRPLTRPHPN